MLQKFGNKWFTQTQKVQNPEPENQIWTQEISSNPKNPNLKWIWDVLYIDVKLVSEINMSKSNSDCDWEVKPFHHYQKFSRILDNPLAISIQIANFLLQITSNTKVQGPKITITRAPTIDQSELEFLYPIPEPDEVVPTHQTNLKSADSPIRIEVNGFSISSRENSASTTIVSNMQISRYQNLYKLVFVSSYR